MYVCTCALGKGVYKCVYVCVCVCVGGGGGGGGGGVGAAQLKEFIPGMYT